MGKTITSPVPRWPGTVIIADPMTLPQFAAWEDCMIAGREAKGASSFHLAYLPGIIACVEEWNLEGGFPKRPTPDTIPVKPYAARQDLFLWLINEITRVWLAEGEIPNE